MVSYRLVAAAGFFASAYALPLNINLGAYSPALYVALTNTPLFAFGTS